MAHNDGDHVGLIGDVLGSRRASDRRLLQEALVAALAEVDSQTGGDLAMTVGDEFQGHYDSVEAAVYASLLLHLSMHGVARLRIGIGRGELTLEGDSSSQFGQDGPVWWRARDAVDAIAAGGDKEWTRVETRGSDDALLNAYLRLRDAILSRLDRTDSVLCLGLLAGETQKHLAGRLGLNQSSVSRRVNRHGVAALVAASEFARDVS